jgi:hypothetical protein
VALPRPAAHGGAAARHDAVWLPAHGLPWALPRVHARDANARDAGDAGTVRPDAAAGHAPPGHAAHAARHAPPGHAAHATRDDATRCARALLGSHTHTHTHIHTYAHTHTHTHTRPHTLRHLPYSVRPMLWGSLMHVCVGWWGWGGGVVVWGGGRRVGVRGRCQG